MGARQPYRRYSPRLDAEDLIVLANLDGRYRSSRTAGADSIPHQESIPQWQELLRRMDSESAVQGIPGSTEPLIQP